MGFAFFSFNLQGASQIVVLVMHMSIAFSLREVLASRVLVLALTLLEKQLLTGSSEIRVAAEAVISLKDGFPFLGGIKSVTQASSMVLSCDP